MDEWWLSEETRGFSLNDFKEEYSDYNGGDFNSVRNYPTFSSIRNNVLKLLDEPVHIFIDNNDEIQYTDKIHICVDNSKNNGIDEQNNILEVLKLAAYMG